MLFLVSCFYIFPVSMSGRPSLKGYVENIYITQRKKIPQKTDPCYSIKKIQLLKIASIQLTYKQCTLLHVNVI